MLNFNYNFPRKTCLDVSRLFRESLIGRTTRKLMTKQYVNRRIANYWLVFSDNGAIARKSTVFVTVVV